MSILDNITSAAIRDARWAQEQYAGVGQPDPSNSKSRFTALLVDHLFPPSFYQVSSALVRSYALMLSLMLL